MATMSKEQLGATPEGYYWVEADLNEYELRRDGNLYRKCDEGPSLECPYPKVARITIRNVGGKRTILLLERQPVPGHFDDEEDRA